MSFQKFIGIDYSGSGTPLRRSGDSVNDLLLTLGKAQVDAMFRRQDDYPVDDSEFLPLVEAVLTAFKTAGFDQDVVEAVWEYAFHGYDRACKEASDGWVAAGYRTVGSRMGAAGVLVVCGGGWSPCPQTGDDACG
jgi:hypothetical protein